MRICASLPAFKLAVKKPRLKSRSHCWKTRTPGVPVSFCGSPPELCNMYAAHSQPITEGPAALQPHLYGNLNFLPTFQSLVHFSLADMQTLWSAKESKSHRPEGLVPTETSLNASVPRPPPPTSTISLPPIYTSSLPHNKWQFGFKPLPSVW